jgi:peroxiredoxin
MGHDFLGAWHMKRQHIWMAVWLLAIPVPSGMAIGQSPGTIDAYWTLLHEDAVVSDLKLTAAQRAEFRTALGLLDLKLFPLRNKSAKEAGDGLSQIVGQAKEQLKATLTSEQLTRLDKLVLRQLGTRALQQDEVSRQLALNDKQRAAIDKAVAASQAAIGKLREEAAGKSPEALNQQANEIAQQERSAVLATLSDAQKRMWIGLVAADFDLSRLGRTRFKAPELVGNSSDWRNSPPLTIAGERGKVVVVHFFACGCINCIRNYPIYRKWHAELAGKGVTLIGIHTPETRTERDIAHLERKLKEDDLAFPVLIDNDQANWNAWGNSMWPSVYVMDKQGDLRHFWAGELKWQGAKGEEITREWIDRLLKE